MPRPYTLCLATDLLIYCLECGRYMGGLATGCDTKLWLGRSPRPALVFSMAYSAIPIRLFIAHRLRLMPVAKGRKLCFYAAYAAIL